MTDLRQAAQAVLERWDSPLWQSGTTAAAIADLRTALEQPEQEPTCPECKAAVLYECVACSSNNYPPKPEQEPVGWEHHEYRPYGAPGEIRIHAILASQYMMPDGSVSNTFQWLVDEYKKDKNTIKLIPLYAAPPSAQPEQVDCPRCGHVCSQREWKGLTDEDVNRESAPIAQQMKLAFHAGMYVAQKILQERNT